MGMWLPSHVAPDFRWRFMTADGETIEAAHRDVKKVLDKRGAWEEPRLVFEITLHVNNKTMIRRLWPEDIRELEQIPV